MDVSKKKPIIFIVSCLVLAAGVTVFTRSGGGSIKNPIQMLCVECNAEFEVSHRQFDGHIKKYGPMAARGMPFRCPECGEDSAYMAVKCKKCATVFLMDPAAGDYPDICPECGYSEIEERHRNKR